MLAAFGMPEGGIWHPARGRTQTTARIAAMDRRANEPDAKPHGFAFVGPGPPGNSRRFNELTRPDLSRSLV